MYCFFSSTFILFRPKGLKNQTAWVKKKQHFGYHEYFCYGLFVYLFIFTVYFGYCVFLNQINFLKLTTLVSVAFSLKCIFAFLHSKDETD